jgi:hypothetical protein
MSDTNSAKSCLLIIPKKFYSFKKIISNALTEKGYEVTVSNDEYPEGTVGKIMGKLQLPFLADITCKAITEKYLKGKSYDIALIFKGRGMSEKLIDEIKKSAGKVVAYNWDSFKYNPAPLKWYKSVDKFYTFDYFDADQLGIEAKELFSSLAFGIEQQKRKYEISAVLRNRPGRLNYIDKVLSVLKPESVFISIYEQNIYTLAVNFLKAPKLYLKYKSYISFVAFGGYNDILKQSHFTIDYTDHSIQSGINMRSYEAINMKTKIITNNDYMYRSSYFNNTNCVVFGEDGDTEKLESDYTFCKTHGSDFKSRDISLFIEELVS